MQSVFFVTLLLVYFIHDMSMSWLFKKKYHKEDDFIGGNAPDDVQRYFGKAMYLIFGYYLLVFVYVTIGFDFWGLVSEVSVLSRPILQICGFLLSILFLILMTLTRLNLGASWRVGLDYNTKDTLVTHGFYRYIRNPYFSFLIAFEGSLILISPNALIICAFIQSALLLGLQVRQEEIFLEKKYGEQYQVYKRITGRFLPKIL